MENANNARMLATAESIKQATEELDTAFLEGGADLLGVPPKSYHDTTVDLFIAAKHKARESGLAPMMAELLAYAEELHQRIGDARDMMVGA